MLTEQAVRPDLSGLRRLETLIGPDRTVALRRAADRIRDRLAGGTLWQVNSTAAGGGVAEMLSGILPLYAALGVPVGWLVVGGDEDFFTVTKRLGAALYGVDEGPLDRAAYEHALAAAAAVARAAVGPRDVMLLHDHQTAGMAPLLVGAVAGIYWRCHVGVDEPTATSTAAWDYLTPYLDPVDGLVFSVPWHVPARFHGRPVAVIPPFLNPFAPKNAELTGAAVEETLARCGLRDRSAGIPVVAECQPAADAPLVLQISRWDRLKDMDGVLTAFAEGVDTGHLVLAGPDPAGIPDDRDQQRWFDRCTAVWRALPRSERRRATLLCLPMDDLADNAVLVNGLQRAAGVVVQKSLAEGFGLTVTEAMWKARLVVASAVGGIRAQITDGEDGLLVADPTDLAAFAAVVTRAVRGDLDRAAIGAAAHRRVSAHFLPDQEITRTAALLDGR